MRRINYNRWRNCIKSRHSESNKVADELIDKMTDELVARKRIIDQMEKNNTTLEEEKSRIQKQYDTIKGYADIGIGMSKAGKNISMITNILTSIDKDLGWNVEVLAKDKSQPRQETFDEGLNNINGNIEQIAKMISNPEPYDKYSTYDMFYFKAKLKEIKYEFLPERGKIVDFHLKYAKQYEQKLNKILDIHIALNDAEINNTTVININKTLEATAKYMSLLVSIINIQP